ncbi:MAG: GxxExxY protein [Chthoniobacterales bacterium]|nr:GxxExxY protein [Chthoniobacterales bacterium]
MKTPNELSDIVRKIAYAIHLYLGHGHLEKVYENTLVHRLQKAGLRISQQHPISVYDEDGTLVGEYFADVLIEDSLIVELKACQTITAEHSSQILGYLKAIKIENGLLINFGSYKFQIKKFTMAPIALHEHSYEGLSFF